MAESGLTHPVATGNIVGSNPTLDLMKTEKLQKGEIAELRCITKLSSMGFVVSSPEVTCSYDFIVDTGKELYRVQCKSSYTKERDHGMTVTAGLTMTTKNNSGKNTTTQYTEDEIDAFIIYSDELSDFFWIDIDEDTPYTIERRPSGWKEYLLSERFK